MIHRYDNAAQTRWNRGEFKVQINIPSSERPIGFCDGTDEDIAELHAIAEAEGADSVEIRRKLLKTGREIWTLLGDERPGMDDPASLESGDP